MGESDRETLADTEIDVKTSFKLPNVGMSL
jgi:hypothetical protein